MEGKASGMLTSGASATPSVSHEEAGEAEPHTVENTEEPQDQDENQTFPHATGEST